MDNELAQRYAEYIQTDCNDKPEEAINAVIKYLESIGANPVAEALENMTMAFTDGHRLTKHLDAKLGNLRKGIESNPAGDIYERNENSKIYKQMVPYSELYDIVKQYTKPKMNTENTS